MFLIVKDERDRSSTTRPTWESLEVGRRGYLERWSVYGLFLARGYHIDLNCTEKTSSPLKGPAKSTSSRLAEAGRREKWMTRENGTFLRASLITSSKVTLDPGLLKMRCLSGLHGPRK